MAAAPFGELAARNAFQMFPSHDHLAAIGVIQSTQQMEDGGLARA
jgi:hypothetical protein